MSRYSRQMISKQNTQPVRRYVARHVAKRYVHSKAAATNYSNSIAGVLTKRQHKHVAWSFLSCFLT